MSAELKLALNEMENRIEVKLKEQQQKLEDGEKVGLDERAELKSMLKDCSDMNKELQNDVVSLKDEIAGIMQKGIDLEQKELEQKSLGEQLVQSEQFKNFVAGNAGRIRVETKNTILTGGDNSVTPHQKLPGVVEGAFRMLSVFPTIDQTNSTSNILYYSRELSWTNNAAGQTEGAAKAESALTFEEVATPIQTIAHFIKVSRQALDDSDFLAGYIDRRMRHGVQNKIEQQIISGDGTGTNFGGWLATGNSTATSPLLTIDIFGLTNKMKYEIIAADRMPDFFYFNPIDWANLETQRRASTDNAFIAASGAVNYVNNGLTPLLWGLPVVVSNNVPAGTVFCKSRDADMYANRSGTIVEMFEQDDTNVQSNLVTVRGEARGAALNFYPDAIRTGDISAITSPP